MACNIICPDNPIFIQPPSSQINPSCVTLVMSIPWGIPHLSPTFPQHLCGMPDLFPILSIRWPGGHWALLVPLRYVLPSLTMCSPPPIPSPATSVQHSLVMCDVLFCPAFIVIDDPHSPDVLPASEWPCLICWWAGDLTDIIVTCSGFWWYSLPFPCIPRERKFLYSQYWKHYLEKAGKQPFDLTSTNASNPNLSDIIILSIQEIDVEKLSNLKYAMIFPWKCRGSTIYLLIMSDDRLTNDTIINKA